jgi:hypothetical protein
LPLTDDARQKLQATIDASRRSRRLPRFYRAKAIECCDEATKILAGKFACGRATTTTCVRPISVSGRG